MPLALCLIACAAPSVLAQQPRARPAPASRAVGFIRGVVYDSLAHAPLEGARVLVSGSELAATTDAGGRFRLDSVPAGTRTLIVEHPVLDTIGLSQLGTRVRLGAGRVAVVEIAIPSLWSMRRVACGGRATPFSRDSGLAFGAVRDAATGARLAGARVLVAWTTASRGPGGELRVDRPTVAAATDSLGNYYACDVSTDYVVIVQAQAGASSSGATELLLGERGVARRDLLVSRTPVVVDSLSGLRRGGATLVGTAIDEFGRPRPSARASVDDAVGEAFADTAGTFVLRNLPAGSQMLMVRMIGYSAARAMVDLRNGDTTRVTVQMREVTVLDTIRVTASRRANNELDELEERARSGFGYRFSAEQLRTRTSMRSVFQGLPNLTISGPSVYNFQLTAIVSGRNCPVSLYVDGMRGSVDELQSYRPEQLIGLEYYPRPEQAPLRFQQVASNCPIALVWTRFIR
jgi:hypothetical protein